MMYTLNIYTFYFKNKIDLAFPPPQKKKNNKQTNTELIVNQMKIGGGSGVERLYISPFFN